jgi:RNA polymerase subunit RPABC4/transcription elongation factor Spt4
MTLPANLNVYISTVLFVLGAYLFAVYLGLVVWTFKDIHARTRDVLGQIMATLLVAIFTLPGLLVYVLLRPHTTLAEEYERSLAEESLLQELEERRICPTCQRRIEPDFVVCPNCHHALRRRCVSCGRLLNPNWDVCPYCGVYHDQDERAEVKSAKGNGGAATPLAVKASTAVVTAVPPVATPTPTTPPESASQG